MADDLTMNVDYVRRLLDECHWTWADLADAMKVSKSTVSRVVSGRYQPGRKFIFALITVFPEHAPHLFTNVQVHVQLPPVELAS